MWVTNLLLFVAVFAGSQASVLPLTDVDASPVARNSRIVYYFHQANAAPTPITSGNAPTTEQGFNPNNSVIILIHDHRGHSTDGFSRDVSTAFRYVDDINLFVMDWQVPAGGSYSNAVRELPAVARDLADFLRGLPTASNDNVHIIGFGMGAHLAGQAGIAVEEIRRITGLDPPGRSFGSNTQRLTTRSARHVEVLHTDGGPLGSGIGSVLGHIDVFINGGYNQPGCLTSSCNHDRAYAAFIQSLDIVGLYGYRCSSMANMNLNNCGGARFSVGGYDPEDTKFLYSEGIYRANIPR